MTATYRYRASTPEGHRVTGLMSAESSDDVVARLRARALFVTSIARNESIIGQIEAARAVWPVSRPPLVTLFRSFATLIHAGVPLTRSLEIARAQCSHRRLREALSSALADIQAGAPLSEALRRHGGFFKPVYVAMIEAGEIGGLLDEVLERISTLLERERAVRKKVTTALTYPACVLLAASALVVLLVATIVPTFARMFTQLQVPLPIQTRVLVAVGESLRRPSVWLLAGVVVIGLAALAVSARHNLAMSRTFDRIVLRVPVLGTLTRKTITARLCRMLGSLLRSGVNLLNAVEIMGAVSGHDSFREALRDLYAALREGEPFAESLARSRLFDPMTLQLSRVGEETGTLDQMLFKIADYYDVDVEAATSTLAALLEPILMLGVGALVGTIVFSIFVPLYSVISQVR